MSVTIERVQGDEEARMHAATNVMNLAETVLSNLVAHYPQLAISPEQVPIYYEEQSERVFRSYWRQAQGYTTNRLGSRPACMYTAHDGGEIVGWLTTAADYSNNTLKKRMNSYLWLVNGGVHPEHQRQGIMRSLLETALTDKERPRVLSFRTFVSAYPLVLLGEAAQMLPVEEGLVKIGVIPTDPPFEDDAMFGTPVWLQRHQGESPEAVARML